MLEYLDRHIVKEAVTCEVAFFARKDQRYSKTAMRAIAEETDIVLDRAIEEGRMKWVRKDVGEFKYPLGPFYRDIIEGKWDDE